MSLTVEMESYILLLTENDECVQSKETRNWQRIVLDRLCMTCKVGQTRLRTIFPDIAQTCTIHFLNRCCSSQKQASMFPSFQLYLHRVEVFICLLIFQTHLFLLRLTEVQLQPIPALTGREVGSILDKVHHSGEEHGNIYNSTDWILDSHIFRHKELPNCLKNEWMNIPKDKMQLIDQVPLCLYFDLL